MFFHQPAKAILAAALSFLLSLAIHAEPIKAATWNLEWFPGGRPNASRTEMRTQTKAIAKVLETLSPQIFLAQELTDQKAFEKLISSVPGMKLDTFSRFLDPESGKIGPQQCAIASTLKANSAWFESFKPTENLPNLRRGFAFAALEAPEGGLIMVYSVHLKSNRGSDTAQGEIDVANTRAESARQLITHKAEMEKKFADQKIAGWVIGGDFNTNDDGQFPKCTAIRDLVAAGFHNSWDATPKEDRLTWHNSPNDTRFKPTTFDFMLTKGFQETQAKVFPGIPVDVSDHSPVLILLANQSTP